MINVGASCCKSPVKFVLIGIDIGGDTIGLVSPVISQEDVIKGSFDFMDERRYVKSPPSCHV